MESGEKLSMKDVCVSPRRARFAEEFLKDLDGRAAAIRAGYSPRTAASQASRLLRNVKVASLIAAGKQARAEAVGIGAEWVLREAVALYQRCIQEIKPALHPKTRRHMTDEAGNRLYTFNAAVAARALELVGKHVAVRAFREDVHLSGELSLVERLQAGRARVANYRKAATEPAGSVSSPAAGEIA
jgi:phage terminase small subunit